MDNGFAKKIAGTVIQVALDIPLPKLFDYLAVDAVPGDVGRLCHVPFGRAEKTGLIVAVNSSSTVSLDKLRAVLEIRQDLPPLPPHWIELAQFCSHYYLAPLGEVVAAALPPRLRARKKMRQKFVKQTEKEEEKGGTVRPTLLPEQAQAIETIGNAWGSFVAFLLHGVTGSGKTEVYLRLIEQTLNQGKQALLLVPEIALTPQLEARIAQRFPDACLVSLHSGLAQGARAQGFLSALTGEANIVLGTRLAVFTPLPNLGLIVVDEEHDSSFKQQDGIRYSARDVAIWRAKQQQVPIVLGSATPSLESYAHALSHRYQLLTLSRRAVAENLPVVRCVNVSREQLTEGISEHILKAIKERLRRGEQSLIFLNRRGYSPVLACTACGWMSRCEACAANKVLHLADRRLRCHHCGSEGPIPRACPSCGNQDIHPFGRGTQRLEESLIALFPDANILRLDRDTAKNPRDWQAMLEQVHSGQADILVGTQILSKGHDFQKLTLVAVLNADSALFSADFRAPEHLFAMLCQVGGRSGRADLPGEVLIQTRYPEHPVYRALVNHDYVGFATSQLAEREQAGFPPTTFQAMLRAEGRQLKDALDFLKAAKAQAQSFLTQQVSLYDVVPMRLYRRANFERAQLLIESAIRPALQNFLHEWEVHIRQILAPRELRWHIDVDPLEF